MIEWGDACKHRHSQGVLYLLAHMRPAILHIQLCLALNIAVFVTMNIHLKTKLISHNQIAMHSIVQW